MTGLRDVAAACWLAWRLGLAIPAAIQRVLHPDWQMRRG